MRFVGLVLTVLITIGSQASTLSCDMYLPNSIGLTELEVLNVQGDALHLTLKNSVAVLSSYKDRKTGWRNSGGFSSLNLSWGIGSTDAGGLKTNTAFLKDQTNDLNLQIQFSSSDEQDAYQGIISIQSMKIKGKPVLCSIEP